MPDDRRLSEPTGSGPAAPSVKKAEVSSPEPAAHGRSGDTGESANDERASKTLQSGKTIKSRKATENRASPKLKAKIWEDAPGTVKFLCFFLQLAYRHPFLAFGLLGLLAAGYLLSPLGARWQDAAVSFVCGNLPGACPSTADDQTPLKMEISLDLSRCGNGYLYWKLRATRPALAWGDGMERLFICANATVEAASPSQLLPAFVRRFPKCLTVTHSDAKEEASPNYGSGVVCRVPYAYRDGKIIPSTYELGIDLCLPAHSGLAIDQSRKFDLGNGVAIYGCNPEIIKSYGY